MNQLVLGASIPFLAFAAAYALRRGRASLGMLIAAPLTMAAGALWAVVPDIPRVLGRYDLYDRLSRDPRMNVFFFHHAIDQVEVDTPLYLAAFFIMGAGLMAAAWRELSARERES